MRERYSPATLGTTLAVGLDLLGDCVECRREVRVDTDALKALAARCGSDAALVDVMARVVCRTCGGRAELRVHVPGLALMGASLRDAEAAVEP